MKMKTRSNQSQAQESAVTSPENGLEQPSNSDLRPIQIDVKIRVGDYKFHKKLRLQWTRYGLEMALDYTWTYHGLYMDLGDFKSKLRTESIERERERVIFFGLYKDYIDTFGNLRFSKVMDLVRNKSILSEEEVSEN